MAEVIFEKAKQVSSPLNIKLNGGTTEGTNQFTYNGSASKTINITPSSIGAATSGHSHSAATTSTNGFMTSDDKKVINSIGLVSSLGTASKEVVGAINEVNNRVSSVNSTLDGKITSLQGTVNNLNTQMGSKVTVGSSPQLTSIELSFTTPFIDFHFNRTTADFTSRIIEEQSGVLSVNGVKFNRSSISMDANIIYESGRALSSKYAAKGGYKILSVQNVVVRCGSLAANGGTGEGRTNFTPVSGASQYILMLVADGWVTVSGAAIVNNSQVYATFVNTSDGAHTGAGVFNVIAIGPM